MAMEANSLCPIVTQVLHLKVQDALDKDTVGPRESAHYIGNGYRDSQAALRPHRWQLGV